MTVSSLHANLVYDISETSAPRPPIRVFLLLFSPTLSNLRGTAREAPCSQATSIRNVNLPNANASHPASASNHTSLALLSFVHPETFMSSLSPNAEGKWLQIRSPHEISLPLRLFAGFSRSRHSRRLSNPTDFVECWYLYPLYATAHVLTHLGGIVKAHRLARHAGTMLERFRSQDLLASSLACTVTAKIS